MTEKTKMVRIHVSLGLGGWAVKVNGRKVGRFNLQADAQACAVFLARLMPSATVKFHNRRGRITQERTYPRSADPQKTPG